MQKDNQPLYRACELARQHFLETLRTSPEGDEGLEYLERRGYDLNSAKEFDIGYAHNSWSALTDWLREEGIRDSVMVEAGLAVAGKDGRRPYDLFRERLIFAIRDSEGRVIGFGGRAINDDVKPKYINSPETPIYNKSNTLYGFSDAEKFIKESQTVLICEGYFDQIALKRHSYLNAVSTSGTSLTDDHAELLGSIANKAVLIFDGDAAGEKANVRATSLLSAKGMKVLRINLPEGSDPDSLLTENPELFKKAVDNARPSLESLIDKSFLNVSTVEETVSAIELVASNLVYIQEQKTLNFYIEALSFKTGLDPTTLRNYIL